MKETLSKMTCSVEEAATLLGVSRQSMYELVHADGFPSFRVGKRILIDIDGLKTWVKTRTEE